MKLPITKKYYYRKGIIQLRFLLKYSLFIFQRFDLINCNFMTTNSFFGIYHNTLFLKFV
jgi:hypothetical protein